VQSPAPVRTGIHALRSLGEICASPSGLRWLSTPGSMTRATPRGEREQKHGRLDGGRLGGGNLGLPPPSYDTAEGMNASAVSAWIRDADP
jgi:hypothetical protein